MVMALQMKAVYSSARPHTARASVRSLFLDPMQRFAVALGSTFVNAVTLRGLGPTPRHDPAAPRTPRLRRTASTGDVAATEAAARGGGGSTGGGARAVAAPQSADRHQGDGAKPSRRAASSMRLDFLRGSRGDGGSTSGRLERPAGGGGGGRTSTPRRPLSVRSSSSARSRDSGAAVLGSSPAGVQLSTGSRSRDGDSVRSEPTAPRVLVLVLVPCRGFPVCMPEPCVSTNH